MNVETRINSSLDVRDQFPAIVGWHFSTAPRPRRNRKR